MNHLNQLYTFFLFAVFLIHSPALGATTLDEAFQAAVKQSETIALQEASIQIAEERYSQARGSLFPRLNAFASYLFQDKPSDPLAEAFFPQSQPEVKLSLNQPLFRGLREFNAIKQFGHLTDAEKYAKQRAIQLLYDDVARSFHAVLATEEDLGNIQTQLKLYDERTGVLAERVRTGTSSETDLLTLQASQAAVLSQYRAAQSSVAAAREALVLLTGLPREVELVPTAFEEQKLKPVDEYLGKIEQRPDIARASSQVQAADAQTRVARGGHLPSLDLTGNYYFVRPSDVYEGMNWDVRVELILPIYSGGTISAQVREAALEREKSELDLALLKRQAEREIRTFYQSHSAGLEGIKDLENSLALSEKNYRLLKSEFQRGLTRNSDVLQALTASYVARRSLLRARFAARDTWVQLHTAAGSRQFQ